jgi:small subunit ribosomal protein S17
MSETQSSASGPGLAGRGYRKVREGLVVSDKMEKTIVVEVEDRVKHGLYGMVSPRPNKL